MPTFKIYPPLAVGDYVADRAQMFRLPAGTVLARPMLGDVVKRDSGFWHDTVTGHVVQHEDINPPKQVVSLP